VDWAYTSFHVLLLTIPVLINFYILIPKFLKKEQYLLFGVVFVSNWLLFSLLIDTALVPLLDALFPNLFFISYPRGWNIFLISAIVLLASTLLKLAEDWFYFNSKQNQLLQLKNQQTENQLSALKAQINPHFLFNSLNVIYALALEKNEKVTEGIVQLSDILRYVLYDTNMERVTLEKELTLIKNYIAFQELRHREICKVKLNVDLENENFQIYPMLLLPLVENAFKHGANGTPEEPAEISIHMIQKEQNFAFTISNPIFKENTHKFSESSGIGLENIRSNLRLVYLETHKFSVYQSEERFSVELRINNKQ
jgi:sensor histidine kinase YesM